MKTILEAIAKHAKDYNRQRPTCFKINYVDFFAIKAVADIWTLEFKEPDKWFIYGVPVQITIEKHEPKMICVDGKEIDL